MQIMFTHKEKSSNDKVQSISIAKSTTWNTKKVVKVHPSKFKVSKAEKGLEMKDGKICVQGWLWFVIIKIGFD